MNALDDVSVQSEYSEQALSLIPGMLKHMWHSGIDAEALSCSIVEDKGDTFVVPEYRLTSGGWLPILDWSFVSLDPARWDYAIPLTGGTWDDIMRKRRTTNVASQENRDSGRTD